MFYMIILISFIAVFFIFSAILFSLFYKVRPVEKLIYYGEEAVSKETSEHEKKSKIHLIAVLAQMVPIAFVGQKKKEETDLKLIRAGIFMKAEELLVIKIILSLSSAGFIYLIKRDWLISLILLIAMYNLPGLIISKKIQDRLKLFNEQINEGIMIISNSLKAGYSFLQAVSVVSEETKDPFSKEFKKLLKEMSLGISIDDGLNNMLRRVPSEDLRLIINAIIIQKDIGGNLSEILDNISETIRERQKIQAELKTLTAQGRLSGMIVVLMPFFLSAIIYLFNKDYILLLLTTKIGIALLIGAGLSQFLGIIIINKIIKIEV